MQSCLMKLRLHSVAGICLPTVDSLYFLFMAIVFCLGFRCNDDGFVLLSNASYFQTDGWHCRLTFCTNLHPLLFHCRESLFLFQVFQKQIQIIETKTETDDIALTFCSHLHPCILYYKARPAFCPLNQSRANKPLKKCMLSPSLRPVSSLAFELRSAPNFCPLFNCKK